jgi:hypothetical protein
VLRQTILSIYSVKPHNWDVITKHIFQSLNHLSFTIFRPTQTITTSELTFVFNSDKSTQVNLYISNKTFTALTKTTATGMYRFLSCSAVTNKIFSILIFKKTLFQMLNF